MNIGNDNGDGDDELLLCKQCTTFKKNFQPEPLSEFLMIVSLRRNARRTKPSQNLGFDFVK